MLLLALLACDPADGDPAAVEPPCVSEPYNAWPGRADPFAEPGTYALCAGELHTDLRLACDDDTPYVFVGQGIDATVLDRAGETEGYSRALTVSGCTVELRDVTITGALAAQYLDCGDGGGECPPFVGGALALDGATVTLTRVRVAGNYAERAGAGVVRASTLTLVDSEVGDNEYGGVELEAGSTVVSEGTTWANDRGADVYLPEGPGFTAGDRTDFTCTAEGCA